MTFRPITPREAREIAQLQSVRFLPGHPDKRFADNMKDATTLTDKQSVYLRKLIYKYRGQL